MLHFNMSVHEILSQLKSERIYTWFDLGIFIDTFRENNPLPSVSFHGTYDKWTEQISASGMTFISFMYSIDGVTIEVAKYTKVFQTLFKDIDIHYIGGRIFPEADTIIPPKVRRFELPEIAGFDAWALYKDFFFTKLERGSAAYNKLILDFWQEVLIIVEKLGNYLEQNKIKLLYVINICSNPGNVSMA